MSAQQLRAMLAQALLDAGPDAPTLCEGWQTRHLAAHLVLREHEPWRLAGLLIPSQRAKADALTVRTGDEAADPQAYTQLVERFAAGPGRSSPMRLVDNAVNVLEYVVHLEDVVRAGTPKFSEYPLPLLEEIGRSFKGRARMMFRKEPARLALVAEDSGLRLAVGARDRDLPLVIARGGLIDLVLLAFGRPAEIRVAGPDDAVADFRARRRSV